MVCIDPGFAEHVAKPSYQAILPINWELLLLTVQENDGYL